MFICSGSICTYMYIKVHQGFNFYNCLKNYSICVYYEDMESGKFILVE